MKKKKKLLAILSMTIAALCAALAILLRPMRTPDGDGGAQAVTLEFYQQREEAIGAFSAVIDAFSAEHSEVNIVQNRAGNSLEYLSARIQRGDMPDLFTHWPTQLSYQAVAEMGKLVSLEDEAFLERVDAGALELCRQDDGSICALPINRNCMEVYYNADLFAELGLSEPRTLDELIAVCDALQAAGQTPMVSGKSPRPMA